MADAARSLISFLAILNPFALCLYLQAVMDDLERKEFVKVLLIASLTSLGVFYLFALAGERAVECMGVHTESLRIFGGVIFFVVGYNYATRGYRAAEMLRGDISELPSAIALPFMIGAGTLTQAVLLGKRHSSGMSFSILVAALTLSFVTVVLFHWLRQGMRRRKTLVFDRYVNILSRVNGLIIGAISTELVVLGTKELWRLSQ